MLAERSRAPPVTHAASRYHYERMPLLYYWRGDNYRRDIDFGAGFHLNQANPLLHEVAIGDSLWAFTRRRDGVYVLAAELVIKAKTLNPKSFRYGQYRVWGDLRLSRYFQVEGQPDITRLVKSLSIVARSVVLGRAFQGHAAVRKIGEVDHRVLVDYATRLPLEPRARLIPEERLEALLISGDEVAVDKLLSAEPSGLIEKRRQYLMTVAARRNPQLAEQLQEKYDGRCQICEWTSRFRYQVDVCEAHHVRWLSRGGEDAISNLILICPNHHRVIHRFDAPFDFARQAFIFPERAEPLALLDHELLA